MLPLYQVTAMGFNYNAIMYCNLTDQKDTHYIGLQSLAISACSKLTGIDKH